MGYIKDRKNSPNRVALRGILDEFREALEDEIEKIEKDGLTSTQLVSGRQIECLGADYWYRFRVEYIPELPADTPCRLIVGTNQFDATVVSFEENAIILATKEQLPEVIASARLENNATVLKERLIKRIEENAEIANKAGKHMLQSNGRAYSARQMFAYSDLTFKQSNTKSQNRAIEAALSNDITYIWGPPGTGKTTVIGQIINELYRHNRSVLVVSNTNTAVDGAIEKADTTYSRTHPDNGDAYPILRIGTPAQPLPKRVLLDHHVDVLGKELQTKKANLENRNIELQRQLDELTAMIAKAVWVEKNKLTEIEEILKTIASKEAHIREIGGRIDEINETIRRKKSEHPEYESYHALSEEIRGKQAKYDMSCKVIQINKSVIDKQQLQKQNAENEIKMHDAYSSLCDQKKRLGSASSLRAELDQIESRIMIFDRKIKALSSKKGEAETVIANHERKGIFGRIMDNSNFKQAQITLQETTDQLASAQERMQQLRSSEKEKEQQLNSLLTLREQIVTKTPTQTRTYWEDELRKAEEQLARAVNFQNNILAEQTTLQSEINSLEQQQKRAKAAFAMIVGYETLLRHTQAQLEDAQAAQDRENARCKEKLDRERNDCAAFFYNPVAQENEALLNELTSLLNVIKSEQEGKDIQTLRRKKEDIKRDQSRIHSRLSVVNQKIQGLEKQAIMNAKIVGSTLTKSYLSDTLRARKFDTVILDEASMASIPALWCAAYLAENSLVIVGDFLQLPPIVMAETPKAKKWLGRDIFDHSGMQELAKNPKTCPKNFIMLNDQFRMESDIADIANVYYGEYGGLHSHDDNAYRVHEREAFYTWFSGEKTAQCIHLIDTESLYAWATGVAQGKNSSRMNCFSAAVDVNLAFKLLENKLNALDPATAVPVRDASVLIVVPYKPQAKRIKQLIELEYQNRGFKENLNLIRAGTIHSFQGSEADIVIFDLVVDEPHRKANLFSTDAKINEELRKMFNVAVTRARFKLYLVGDFAFCQNHAKDNALSEMLDLLLIQKRLSKIDAKKLLPDLIYTKRQDFAYDDKITAITLICRESSFFDYFMSDIRTFKKRLIIYSPFMTQARIEKLLPSFADAIKAGKQIIVVTKALSERRKKEQADYQMCENGLSDIGVHILHKKGMHEKLIFVDDEVVWFGSLNVLSFSGKTGEIMQRSESAKISADYQKLYEIEHLCGAAERAYEQKCPICGDEMQIREGDKGGIFWKCAQEDYSRNPEEPYPVHGEMSCKKCGASYKFVMKNNPYWVCTANPKHCRKVRKNDLKLEKMAALIPTKKERKQVDRYFAEQKKEQEDKQKKVSKVVKAATTTQNTDGFEQMSMF